MTSLIPDILNYGLTSKMRPSQLVEYCQSSSSIQDFCEKRGILKQLMDLKSAVFSLTNDEDRISIETKDQDLPNNNVYTVFYNSQVNREEFAKRMFRKVEGLKRKYGGLRIDFKLLNDIQELENYTAIDVTVNSKNESYRYIGPAFPQDGEGEYIHENKNLGYFLMDLLYYSS